ncbi:hypothetical protein SRHO_G00008260 [Serrasalmus rhombeus]
MLSAGGQSATSPGGPSGGGTREPGGPQSDSPSALRKGGGAEREKDWVSSPSSFAHCALAPSSLQRHVRLSKVTSLSQAVEEAERAELILKDARPAACYQVEVEEEDEPMACQVHSALIPARAAGGSPIRCWRCKKTRTQGQPVSRPRAGGKREQGPPVRGGVPLTANTLEREPCQSSGWALYTCSKRTPLWSVTEIYIPRNASSSSAKCSSWAMWSAETEWLPIQEKCSLSGIGLHCVTRVSFGASWD